MKRNRTIILALRRMLNTNNRNIMNDNQINQIQTMIEFPLYMMEFLESV